MALKVGFIGLGTMGLPFATNILRAGFDLIVHDVRPKPVDELVELANVVKSYGGLYATHMRSEGDNGDWFAAIDEALAVGRGAGVPVQISHMKALGTEAWGRSSEALSRVANARRG